MWVGTKRGDPKRLSSLLGGDKMKYQAMLDLYMPSIEIELLRLLREHRYTIDEASLKSKGRHIIIRTSTYVFKINIQELYRDIFYDEKGEVDTSLNDIEYGLVKLARMVYQRIDLINIGLESIAKMEELSVLYEIKTLKLADGSYEIY